MTKFSDFFQPLDLSRTDFPSRKVDLPEGQFVRFNEDNLTVEITDGEHYGGHGWYEIDLERCHTPAELLDWIYQVLHKTWATPALMWNLLLAFDGACETVLGCTVQGFLHSYGPSRPADWGKAARERCR